MAKSNIRSIRLSDEILEVIEEQTGENFTAKYEALITRCIFELPQKEKELEAIEEKIRNKKHEIALLSSRSAKIINTISDLERKLFALDTAIFDYSEEWKA